MSGVHLVRCDGARVPPRVVREHGGTLLDIGHAGESAQLNINIRLPQVGFRHLGSRATDLLRIAAYAFATDQQVSRGGDADVYGHSWRRSFLVYVPVSEPEFWNTKEVTGALGAALSFVSDDSWSFSFVKQADLAEDGGPIPFDFDPNEVLGSPDLVTLLSGGMDSLASAVEQAAVFGRKPLVVRHSTNFHIGNRQLNLCKALRKRYPTGLFPFASAAVHRRETDAKENTQRTRSFLYASIGSTIAATLSLPDVHLADNGPVSLNLPISDQVHGSMATRSTHPRFIQLYNKLLRLLFPGGPTVTNPLGLRTRAEVLEVFRVTGTLDLLVETNSCAHQRNRSGSQPYCGVCSQCIDRRLSVTAAGLEKYDPPERYEKDMFTDPLEDQKHRTLVLSTHLWALRVGDMTDEVLWEKFPLAECLDPEMPDQGSQARDLTSLVRRQSNTILRGIERALADNSHEIVLQRVHPDSLLAAVGAQLESQKPAKVTLLHSDGFTSVTLEHEHFTLRPAAAKVTEILFYAAEHGTPDVAWRDIKPTLDGLGFGARSMSEVFKSVPNWKNLVHSSGRGIYRLASAA